MSRAAQAAEDYFVTLAADGDAEGAWRVEDGYVDESAGAIAAIDDQTSHGRDATQASALAKPDLDTTTFDVWAAAFSGSQFLQIADTLAAAVPTNDRAVCIVFKAEDTTGNQSMIAVGSTGGVALDIEGANWTLRKQGVGTVVDGAADTDPHVVIFQRISGVEHLIIDGVEVALGASGGSGTPAGVSFIGALTAALFFYFGYFFEAIVLSRVLTGGAPGVGNPATGECADYTAYAQARYGI
jgi:hypothetical protein